MNPGALRGLLADAEIVVCVGPGGVGKTTVAAALGLAGCEAGKKTLVCTIDPAKRLANSLGLSSLGNAETPIDPTLLAQVGVVGRGSLRAMMLDMKQSWDDLVSRYASVEKQRAILENRFY